MTNNLIQSKESALGQKQQRKKVLCAFDLAEDLKLSGTDYSIMLFPFSLLFHVLQSDDGKSGVYRSTGRSLLS